MTDDYAPLARGGLKLKGASKPAGITKKKKKKAKEASTDAPSEPKKSALQKALHEEDSPKNPAADSAVELSEDQLKELEDGDPHDGKTPAERAMEEMRRKRLNERLQKEGVKTHKQRVEELNKYLSNLSEHHDMPRIGPG